LPIRRGPSLLGLCGGFHRKTAGRGIMDRRYSGRLKARPDDYAARAGQQADETGLLAIPTA
jgi:hypothetical protein